MTPLQRSKAALESAGWLVQVVEHWVPRINVCRDLWGIADLFAIRPGERLAVQVTSRDNMSARRRKIADSPATPVIRSADIAIEIHGWDKGPDGRWRCKVEDVS